LVKYNDRRFNTIHKSFTTLKIMQGPRNGKMRSSKKATTIALGGNTIKPIQTEEDPNEINRRLLRMTGDSNRYKPTGLRRIKRV